MIAFQRFPVTITYKDKEYNPNQAFDTETTVTLFTDRMMCIERIPNNRVFAILGEQKNAKATYVLYLELDDPIIPQEADVTWEMYGQTYKGKVKLSMPLSQIVLNRNRECYIQSDNQ